MSFITRGFTGRGRERDDRLPPGQTLVGDFPVLSAGPTPDIDTADWEFTYDGRSGRIHVNNRGFITAPDQAYGMWWSTPDSRWDRYLPDLRLIQRTFVPVDDS